MIRNARQYRITHAQPAKLEQAFARLLAGKAQHMQRDEATDYAGARLTRVSAVIRALGLQVCEEMTLPPSPPQ